MEGETTSPARLVVHSPRAGFNTCLGSNSWRVQSVRPFTVRVEQREPVQSSFAGASHSLHLPIVPTCLAGAPLDPNPSQRSRRDRSLQCGEVRKKEWRSRSTRSSCMPCTVRGREEPAAEMVETRRGRRSLRVTASVVR